LFGKGCAASADQPISGEHIMTMPALDISVEPAESSSVVYGVLAAKTSNDVSNGQLSLVLTITNNELQEIHLNQVTVSFTGSPSVPQSVIAADLQIAASGTKKWYFGPANNIILPVPAPGQVKLDLACDNFSTPASKTLPLAPYVSPAAGGGYTFPAHTGDLKTGEFWTGRSAVHGAAGGGTQLYAYDLLVRAFDAASSSWPSLKPGTDKTKNANYYCWSKPIHAMADGVVVQFKDGIAANTPPGLPSPTPSPVEGNHFYIQHGDDLALYAHFQAGTLNPALTSGPNPNGTGAAVTAGQLLGLCGNSGNSSEPHLHIQVNRTTIPWAGPPRPLPFKDAFALDLTQVDGTVWPPNTDGPWSPMSSEDLPNVLSAIWPGLLLLGKKNYLRWVGPLIWAWIIMIGGLMFTPGGISCPGCTAGVTEILGAVSIGLGIAGFILQRLANNAAAKGVAAKGR
jgi:hypothetical protein